MQPRVKLCGALRCSLNSNSTLRFIPITEPAIHWRLCLAVRRLKPETLAMRAMTAEISDAIHRGVRDGSWRGSVLREEAQ